MKYFVKGISVCLAIMMLFCGCSVENVAHALTIDGENISVAEYKYVFENVKAMMIQEIGDENGTVDWDNATYQGQNAKEAVYAETLEQFKQIYAGAKLAEDAGFKTGSESDKYIGRVREQLIQNAGSEEAYNSFLKEIGSSDNAVKHLYEKIYLFNSFYGQEVDTDAAPTEEEIKNYFLENCVKAKHILFTTVDDNYEPLDDATVAQKEQSANDTLIQLQNGADFDSLMRDLTEDPGLATNPNGYIFGKNMMDPAFETAAYALQPGEISGIVKGSYGYHILKRIALTNADYDEFCADTLQEGVTGKDYLKNQIVYGQLDEQIEQLYETMTIEKNEAELAKMVF